MAFRTKAAIAFCLAVATQAQVVHDHWRKSCSGALAITEAGVSFDGTEHRWNWNWSDIQQATLSSGELRILTYRDSLWKLGADREVELKLPADTPLTDYDATLRQGLSMRYVARFSRPADSPEWSLAAKHLSRFGGVLGVLESTPEGLTFRAEKPDESRTWRWGDIEKVSSAGPYELTLTTYERARLHYGSRRDFTFQLREALTPARFQQLWERVERPMNVLANSGGR